MHSARNVIKAERQWTTLSLVASAAGVLAARGFEEARLHAELLLAHVLGIPRLQLYLQFDKPLTTEEVCRFRALIERRLRHEPLQYITEETEFMGLPLTLGPGVLIPRPETEILVEHALTFLAGRTDASVLDIGTGSGNIAIAVARRFPRARVVSIDTSEAALALAARNCTRNNATNVRLVRADVFENVLPGETFDMILSNTPYVPQDQFAGLQEEVRGYEPEDAVTDHADGFRFITRIIGFSRNRLRPGGALFMEIGFGQAERTRDLLRQAGYEQIGIAPDYAAIPRVAMGLAPGGTSRTDALHS